MASSRKRCIRIVHWRQGYKYGSPCRRLAGYGPGGKFCKYHGECEATGKGEHV